MRVTKKVLRIPEPSIPEGVEPDSYIKGFLAGYGDGYRDGVRWAGDEVMSIIKEQWGRDSK